jgi:hypothetical protein
MDYYESPGRAVGTCPGLRHIEPMQSDCWRTPPPHFESLNGKLYFHIDERIPQHVQW